MYPFTETQKFRQWWLWLFMIAVTALELYRLPQHIMEHKALVFTKFGIVIAVALLLYAVRLTTRIDGTGIHYAFFPFHWSEKHIDWADVAEAYVRQYSPLGEYGGWGIRYSFGNGKAYNIAGNKGLQVVLKSGKKILIGTQKQDELNAALQSLRRDGIIAVGATS